MERATLSSERRTAVAIGTGLVVLGAMVLVGGIVNLALAPAMAASRGDAPGFLLTLGGLPPWMAVGFLVIQYWRSFVVIQFLFGGTALGAGIGILRCRWWARSVVEALGWTGTALAAVPLFWVGRSVFRSPADRMLGLRAGLETLPEAGQALATGIQLLVGGPAEIVWGLLSAVGVIQATGASRTMFAWTDTGIFLGTVASIGIPVASAFLIIFVRRRGVREAFARARS